jgi:hypothetical protein
MSSHYFHEHDTAIETMSYNLHEHKEGIQPSSTSFDMDIRCIPNQRLKPKDSLSSHQDSITSLLASMHLSGISSFGDSFGDDSAPELLSLRYDDKELDKYFDFGESEKPDDAFATQSTASRIAQASLEFVFSHLDMGATDTSGTNSGYVAEELRCSDSIDSLEVTSKRMKRVSHRNETFRGGKDTVHDQ